MFKYSIYLLSVIVFIGCAGDMVTIHPDYQDVMIKGAILDVIPPGRDGVKINCPNEIRDCLGMGDSYEVFVEYFAEKFPAALLMVSTLDSVNYGVTEVAEDTTGLTSRFTLIIEQIELSVNFYIPLEYNFIVTRKFEYENARFTLIDNSNGNVVSQEKLTVSRNYNTVDIKSLLPIFNHLTIALAKSIIRYSPFRDPENIWSR